MGQKNYTEGFKKQAVEKIFSLNEHENCTMLAEDLGVAYSTLMKWKGAYSKSSMTKKTKKEFTAEEKLEALNKQFSFSESEFGEYLRSKGLLSSDVETWRAEFLNSSKTSVKGPGRPKKDPELHRLEKDNKALKKDLSRKDRALAEMSARVILIKKSQKLFGLVDEEEED